MGWTKKIKISILGPAVEPKLSQNEELLDHPQFFAQMMYMFLIFYQYKMISYLSFSFLQLFSFLLFLHLSFQLLTILSLSLLLHFLPG